MMTELVNIASQFRGLPMADLIGAPLTAACDAQVRLANATADFIKYIGFEAPANPNDAPTVTRTATFQFQRKKQDPADPSKQVDEDVTLNVPLLAIVKVPSLAITKVDITFDMEVKSSFVAKEGSSSSASFSADMKVGWGPFSASVHMEGSVASHKENTRTSDNSAKYHVQVLAEDAGMPEGLSRVIDILQTAIQDKA
ncbi:DUF2589 domain-containing protein [Duganella sp. HH101]|jgi:hypothetical protein|uniref:DUF2589 domain-containing protein n=1 Tax=Duganella sp. HH101 TaxID=1781066 RepID=UPI000873C0D6|nr:DUF2589 domain-containing protein [Duganella sp. HH101]